MHAMTAILQDSARKIMESIVRTAVLHTDETSSISMAVGGETVWI